MLISGFIKKVRLVAILSFVIPLFALNCCLLLYKLLGDIDVYPQYQWDKKKIEYSYQDYIQVEENNDSFTYTKCPKYGYTEYFLSTENKKTESFTEAEIWIKNNQLKSKVISKNDALNDRCVKNHPIAYFFLTNINILEKFLLEARKENNNTFAKINNPYLYGETSISRTARYFPATYIFKPLIILTAFFLFYYWKNNLNLFNEIRKKDINCNFSKKFFYFGILSCIFLILHATFLGIDIDSKLFSRFRRLIIILFVLFEIFSQLFLTKSLFGLRKQLDKYINSLILKIKIAFISLIFFITVIAFVILVWGNSSTEFKHILEWNYFSFLLLYYMLSRLFWKGSKTRVHTPEGA